MVRPYRCVAVYCDTRATGTLGSLLLHLISGTALLLRRRRCPACRGAAACHRSCCFSCSQRRPRRRRAGRLRRSRPGATGASSWSSSARPEWSRRGWASPAGPGRAPSGRSTRRAGPDTPRRSMWSSTRPPSPTPTCSTSSSPSTPLSTASRSRAAEGAQSAAPHPLSLCPFAARRRGSPAQIVTAPPATRPVPGAGLRAFVPQRRLVALG